MKSDWYKRFAFRDETGITLANGARIIRDERFGRCVHLPNEEARLTLEEHISELGLHKANFTLSFWIHLDAGEAIVSLGTDTARLRVGADWAELHMGERDNPDFPGVRLPIGEWHYLAWVKEGDSHRLSIDGIKESILDVGPDWGWGPHDALYLGAGDPGVKIARFKCYPRVLSEQEVLADYYTEVPTAIESFVEQYPVDFAIANLPDSEWKNYPDNKLFIVDAVGKTRVRQKIRLTNVSGRDITLNATENASAAANNFHFAVRFRNATFSEPAIYPEFAPQDGWSIRNPSQNPDDGSWSIHILSLVERTLSVGEHLEFPFEYTTADGALGARGTQVVMSYRNLQYDSPNPILGIRNKQVDIINLSSSNEVIQRINEGITTTDTKVDDLEEKVEGEIKGLGEHFDALLTDDETIRDSSGKQVENPIVRTRKEAIEAKNAARIDGVDGKIGTEASRSGRVKRIAALSTTSIKGLFEGIINVIKTLAENIKAVDEEVDKRAEATNAIRQQLQTPFPLVVAYNAPAGVVCNDTDTEIELSLHNRSDETVTFTGNAEFRFIFSIGNGVGDLAKNHQNTGVAVTPLTKDTNASHDSSIFRWKPEKAIAGGETLTFTIRNCAPNPQPGTAVMEMEYQGVKEYPAGRLVLAIPKITRDLAKLAGGENVGIGTTDPKVPLHIVGQTDVTLTENTGELIVGDAAGLHLAIDNNEMMAKSSGTQASHLYLNREGGDISMHQAHTHRAFVVKDDGKVGIGTESPMAKLDVRGDVAGWGIVPIGTVIDWWRPEASIPIPEGWHIANGYTFTQNDVDGGKCHSSLNGKTLPDMTNRFVRGLTSESHSGYTTGGSDEHSHSSGSFKADSEGRHVHEWLDTSSSSKTVYSYNSSGSRKLIKDWDNKDDRDGQDIKGSGHYSVAWSSWSDFYTSKTGNHTHSISGSSAGGENIPKYIGLLKLVRVK
uniref:Concanavalin A-like lectin/glucanases superfamily protein n=1 Tax=Candidatus Kentrum sp. FW TaxID=2126338 RepID=A0A450SBV5_9GAMM|nr:MAG: Concanavalin A-like lectin/glucanases superfamily protein [Candidatus Kentron sp. FW]